MLMPTTSARHPRENGYYNTGSDLARQSPGPSLPEACRFKLRQDWGRKGGPWLLGSAHKGTRWKA
eukprot:8709751-Alexandrium_andersonii.AAC.1